MSDSIKEQAQPQVPPMEDPPLPDSYEPSPGEIPNLPDPPPQKEKDSKSQ
jgi:hypothetical protein